MDNLKRLIREVPDFPKPGILFYDLTTLLKDAAGLRATLDALTDGHAGKGIDIVAGIRLNAGFVPIRKLKKLPSLTERVEYALEYGTDGVEIHRDAVEPGQRVLIVDDVLATGGTASAAVKLIEILGGKVAGLSFVIELDFLKGRDKLTGYEISALLHY